MSSIRFTTRIDEDRTIRLPEGVEIGPGNVEVTIVQPCGSADEARAARTSLADWAEQHAEHWGRRLSAADVSSFTDRRF